MTVTRLALLLAAFLAAIYLATRREREYPMRPWVEPDDGWEMFV